LLLRQRRQLHARVGHLLAAPGRPTAEREALYAHFARSDDLQRGRRVARGRAGGRARAVVPGGGRLLSQAFEMAEGRPGNPEDVEFQHRSLQGRLRTVSDGRIYSVASLDEANGVGKAHASSAEQLNEHGGSSTSARSKAVSALSAATVRGSTPVSRSSRKASGR
jgi:hypothetical protein